MSSPFPGMDPYLESRWGDVHTRLNIYASDMLGELLPPGLIARAEERAIVSDPGISERSVYPDVMMIERGLSEPNKIGNGVGLAEFVCIILPPQNVKQHYLEIRDARSGGQVVTVIEFVSPSNKKTGASGKQYRQKQEECLDAKINLVEIDLTRGGIRKLLSPFDRINDHDYPPYTVVVRRGDDPQRVWIYSLPLRKSLGGIPIPLRENDPVVVLDLQTIVNQIYQRGHYADDLDYTLPLDPPLSNDDANWAEQLISNAGSLG